MSHQKKTSDVSLVNQYGEVDFGAAALILWRARWLVTGITSIFVIASIAYALLTTQWYRAQVLVAPVSTNASTGLTSQLGSLGGLASLAGINVGGGNSSEPLAILKSRDLASAFIDQEKLLPVFFSSKWDSSTHRWKGSNSEHWPDIRDGVRYFDERVRSVQEDKKTGLVTLTIEWKDAAIAAQWADQIIDRVNSSMRSRALAEAQANINYLTSELARTDVVTLQQSIGRLLDGEMQKLMLARGKEEFSFRVIDRAVPPKWRSHPKQAQVVVVGAIFGVLVSVLVVFVSLVVQRRSAQSSH